MKFTIEVEQEAPDKPPQLTVSVNGKTISLIQRMEFEARAGIAAPKAMIRLPDVSKLEVKMLGGDDGALAALKATLSHHKKLLSNFPWIDVP